jgi:hypothetical protein
MRQLKINLNISVNHFNAHDIRRESGQRSFVKSIETASRKTIPFLLDTRYENMEKMPSNHNRTII